MLFAIFHCRNSYVTRFPPFCNVTGQVSWRILNRRPRLSISVSLEFFAICHGLKSYAEFSFSLDFPTTFWKIWGFRAPYSINFILVNQTPKGTTLHKSTFFELLCVFLRRFVLAVELFKNTITKKKRKTKSGIFRPIVGPPLFLVAVVLKPLGDLDKVIKRAHCFFQQLCGCRPSGGQTLLPPIGRRHGPYNVALHCRADMWPTEKTLTLTILLQSSFSRLYGYTSIIVCAIVTYG